MAQSFPPSQAPAAPQPAGVTLSCRPNRAGNRLVFPYTVANHSPADIYVMDAALAPDRGTGKLAIERNTAVIWLGSDGFAHVLKGIAALPADRSVDMRIIPLAAKLPPGDALERSLEVPLPLAETSPYYPDLPLRDYELTDIQGVVLTIEFLRSSVEGFAAEPAADAPDLFRVRGQHTVGQSERVSCAFPSRQLQILKRPGDFPRPD